MKPIPNPAEIRPKFCARLPGSVMSAMKASAVACVAAATPATSLPASRSQMVPATDITT
jgi:hypothetical protein